MKFFLTVCCAFITAAVYCSGTPGIIELAFDKMQLSGGAMPDDTVKVGDTPSLKLVCKSAKHHPKAEISIELDKDVAFYELSFYVKTDNIVSAKPVVYGADIILKSGKGGGLRFSSRGSYKCDVGTMDWKKVTYKINAQRYLKEQPVKITLHLAYAAGTAWFDQVKLIPFNAKSQVKTGSKSDYTFGIFPCCYQKAGEVYEIAENLPAQWLLKCLARPQNPSRNGVLTFELELPDFLEFNGVGGFSSRVGKGYFARQKFATFPGRKGYKKYISQFDSGLSGITFTDWRKNCMMINALPGSAGKSGFAYWKLNLDGKCISKGAEAVKVVPPVKMTEKPCKRFKVGVFSPVSRNSVFRGGRETKLMYDFWNSLTADKPMLFAGAAHGQAPEYDYIIYLGGFQLEGWLGLPEQRELLKSVPKRVGKAVVPSWYMLDDPDGKFEAYLTAMYAYFKKNFPGEKDMFVNVEPYVEQGYDQAGRERFARTLKLEKVPTVEECQKLYREEWAKYMLEVHRQLMEKIAGRIKKEGYNLFFCTNKIDSRFGPGVWTAGVDAIHAGKFSDINCIMGYAIGSKFFDDVSLNVKHQPKPVFPGQDPAEEYKAWYDIYTPAGIRQNAVAAAALGCMGLWYYPSDALSGKYLRAIAEGYSMVSKYEDIYFDGKRVDKEYTLAVKNAASRKVKGLDGKETVIYYPDFSGKLRFTAHEYKGKTLLTIFNYTDERLIVEVTGKGRKFLIGIDKWDLAQVFTDNVPRQNTLVDEAAAAVRKFGSPVLKEHKQGNADISWGAGIKGEPVIRLTKGRTSIDLDVFNTLNINSLRFKNTELLRNGFIGKAAFNLAKQNPVTGEVVKLGIVNGLPQVVIKHVVPRYSDEDNAVNPLEKLEVTRTFTLEERNLFCQADFRNSTGKTMPMAARLCNMVMPGSRFGSDVKRELLVNGKKADNAIDSIYLKAGAVNSFLNKLARQQWDGKVLEVFAQDGKLKDSVKIYILNGEVSGFYSWMNTRGDSQRTVEFLPAETPLKPGEKRSFRWKVSW